MRNIPRDLIQKKTYVVTYLVYEDATGQQRYFYIAVRKDKMPAFQRAILAGNFEPEDYGFILEEGLGEASEVIKEKMKIMYQCDHEGATQLEKYCA
mgnify:CR=1 FL=1|tara:strand:+ start:625 stop:912 length:288 start_codon:yes stop_codon:yes gene_type:complete